LGQERPPLRGDPPASQIDGFDAEPAQLVLRQVDATPVQILGDVAQEVGVLEGETERPGGRERLRAQRLQHRQHHLADHRGRALHVPQQVVPRLVPGGGQIHRHRPVEAVEALRGNAHGADRVADRGQHGIGRPVGHGAAEVGGELGQPVTDLGR
jgi:hypothetical protein